MTLREKVLKFFKSKPKPEAVPQPAPIAPAPPRWASFSGDQYKGTAVYHPVEPMDEAKYERYLAEMSGRRNPKTNAYWSEDELAAELDITVQGANDMFSRAQVEFNNQFLPGTIKKK